MEEAGSPPPPTTENAVEARGVLENFQKSFSKVQAILNHNTSLIREINQNHESNALGSLIKNIGLIRELNTNMGQVVELYANLSAEFAKSIEEDSTSAAEVGAAEAEAEAEAAHHQQPSPNAEVGGSNKQKKIKHK